MLPRQSEAESVPGAFWCVVAFAQTPRDCWCKQHRVSPGPGISAPWVEEVWPLSYQELDLRQLANWGLVHA